MVHIENSLKKRKEKDQIWKYRGEKAEIFGVKEAEVLTTLIRTNGDTRSQERGMGGAIDVSVGAQNRWLRSWTFS